MITVMSGAARAACGMNRRMQAPARALAIIAAPFLAFAATADEASEAEKKAFANCTTCHAIIADGRKRAGPPLGDLIGRQAGTLDGFAYSRAMKDAGQNGLIWDEATLDAYIANPRALVKGAKFLPGIRNATTRRDIIAHLIRHSGG